MIDIGDDGRTLLEQSHASAFVVTASYGDNETIPAVPIDPTQSTLSLDATSQVQGSGTLYVVSQGGSLRPRYKTDPLAAYGQEVDVSLVVGTSVNLALGRYRITDVPSATESMRLNPRIVTGSLVELTIADRFDIIVNDSFLAVTSPQFTSAWAEIQRISPLAIVQSIPDAIVPSSLVYQNKFDAIQQLMKLMGGEPALTREGALTARLSAPWTLGLDPVTTINGVISRDDGMSNNLFNCIVVTNSNDATILGIAQISDASNPLSVDGPLGRRVKTIQDPLATTNIAANRTAQTYLDLYSSQQTQVVAVKCLPRWDIELGDVVQINDPVSGEKLIGAVTNMSASLDPTAAMSLQITEATT